MKKHISINGRKVGPGCPTYIVAEMSGNHNQSYEDAVKLLQVAKEAGVDAVKLQTFTADTLTIDSKAKEFLIGADTRGQEGRSLYELYTDLASPWEWQPKLKKMANDMGLDLFSTPFDKTATDFLMKMNVPAFKIASSELIDLPLIEYVAKKKKPMIVSTGMGSKAEIADAVKAVKKAGNDQLILLQCTAAYPTPPEEANLRTISDMAKRFGVPVGLSDHSLGIAVPVAAVALGACFIEKHFCLSRNDPSPDAAFSLEPHELKEMATAIRTAEKSLGEATYALSKGEKAIVRYRRSLYVVEDIAEGEKFTEKNVRSVRPGNGLPPKELNKILGKKATKNLKKGTALARGMIK
jgi:N-acetylneuraminate synthase